MSHYELFAREPGWTVERVLVVSPFIEGSFFEELIDRLRPKSLWVVLDDGCRARDVDTIKAAAATTRKSTKLVLAQAGATGLVHAKIFFVEERSRKGAHRYWLVCGSANASRQGFTPTINAELLVRTRLVARHHQEVIDWMDGVIAAADVATKTKRETRIASLSDVELHRGFHIHFPAFRLGPLGLKDSGFDAWLQQGRLLTEYKVDQSFLHVAIQLKKPLPQSVEVQRATRLGFKSAQTRVLNFAYMEGASLERDDVKSAPKEKWRRKYFVPTIYGEWCSRSCYSDHRDGFKRAGYQKRALAIERLAAIETSGEQANAESRLRRVLTGLWEVTGPDAGEYLKSVTRKEPDYDHYIGKLRDRIERDLSLARDGEFVVRYVTGFEIVDMPRFRSDPSGWEEFTHSFAKQLVYDGLSENRGRYLRDTIDDAFAEAEVGRVGAVGQLVQDLREHWATEVDDDDVNTVGEWIADYHKYGGS